MKKLIITTISTLILSLMGNVNAQQNAPYTNMTGDTTTVDSVIVDATMMYYVEPDPVLNNLTTQYDTSQTNSAQGINSTFDWTIRGGNTNLNSSQDKPYSLIQYDGTAAGNLTTLSVKEISSAGCTDSDSSLVDVRVIRQPVFRVSSASHQHEISICNGNTQAINIDSIGQNQLQGFGHYKFLMDFDQSVVESDLTTLSSNHYTKEDSVVNVNGDIDGVSDITVLGPDTYNTVNDSITRYRYDFAPDGSETVDANNSSNDNGINHHISRKSDFLAMDGTQPGSKTKPSDQTQADQASKYSWFNASAGDSYMITVYVYPRPNTGNIYYVPNGFER